MFETVISITLAIGLAASCGFRIFVPMLVIGVASRVDYVALAEGFDWVSGTPALIVFAIATVVEVAAYYVPWLDNLLDSIATPAAIIAGVIVTAACVTEMQPLMKWSLAIIAGGGTAGTVKGGLAALRVGSTATTGGTANSVVSTVEWIASTALSLLAIFIPLLAGIVAVMLVILFLLIAWKFFSRSRKRAEPEAASK